MRTSDHINRFRNREEIEGFPKADDNDGMNGIFAIPLGVAVFAIVIASDGTDQDSKEVIPWEHVSVRIKYKHNGKWHERVATWREMCILKNIFWKADEVVMQLHPAEANYVNCHPNVLHLWRPTKAEIPLPPLIAV